MGATHTVTTLAGLQPPSGLPQVSPLVDHGEQELGGYYKSIMIKYLYIFGTFNNEIQ